MSVKFIPAPPRSRPSSKVQPLTDVQAKKFGKKLAVGAALLFAGSAAAFYRYVGVHRRVPDAPPVVEAGDDPSLKTYDRIAALYDDAIGTEEFFMAFGFLRRWILSRNAMGDVLEISAGTGRNFPYYEYSQMQSLTLADLSREMLAKAEEKFYDEVEVDPSMKVYFKVSDAHCMVDTTAPPRTPAASSSSGSSSSSSSSIGSSIGSSRAGTSSSSSGGNSSSSHDSGSGSGVAVVTGSPAVAVTGNASAPEPSVRRSWLFGRPLPPPPQDGLASQQPRLHGGSSTNSSDSSSIGSSHNSGSSASSSDDNSSKPCSVSTTSGASAVTINGSSSAPDMAALPVAVRKPLPPRQITSSSGSLWNILWTLTNTLPDKDKRPNAAEHATKEVGMADSASSSALGGCGCGDVVAPNGSSGYDGPGGCGVDGDCLYPSRCESGVLADGTALAKFPPQSFDTVVDTFGLCSHEDPVQVLKEACRVCKPNGRIILLEHGKTNWGFLNDRLDKSACKHHDKWGCWWNRDILSIVRQAGLVVESMHRWHLGSTYIIVARPPYTPLATA